MTARIMSFARDSFGPFAVHDNLHRLRFVLGEALRREYMFHFARPDAECQRAKRAVSRGMAIAAHDDLPFWSASVPSSGPTDGVITP